MCLAPAMEALARLHRRQVEALRAIATRSLLPAGVPLSVVARSLRISPPSALGHLRILESMRLVMRRGGKTRLTPRGWITLREYERHHRLAESLFASLGWKARDACRAAREIDLALTHTTVERLCDTQGHPRRCPHGRPISPCIPRRTPGR